MSNEITLKAWKNLETPSDHMYLTKDIERGQLPEILELAMGASTNPAVRDMLFLSTLSVCSYALPKMKMLHDPVKRKEYSANLMTLIVARAASGKGVMNTAHTLLEPIESVLTQLERSAEIPANCSSAAFLDLLEQNGGSGIMIATEMDELSQIWKHDYGNFSHIFRQAFEHETISRARKAGTAGVVKTTIPHPCLSVLLSGTYNQVQPLLGNAENGLVSRFLPYLLEDAPEFDIHVLDNCPTPDETAGGNLYEYLGKQLGARWGWMMQQRHDCYWRLTDEQAAQLAAFFSDGYHLALDEMGMPDDFAASVFRMLVTVKRIGMILTALRLDIHAALPKEIYCSDDDFRTLAILSEQLLKHAARLSLMLPDAPSHTRPGYTPLTRAEKKMMDFLNALPKKFTTQQAIDAGNLFGFERRTTEQYLTELINNGLIVRIKKGWYQRVY